jgi:hypothetical protein
VTVVFQFLALATLARTPVQICIRGVGRGLRGLGGGGGGGGGRRGGEGGEA